jgi:hypothetical protein
MAGFKPEKLHVTFGGDIQNQVTFLPRCYTLTHSDLTGDLFLTIDKAIDKSVLDNFYTRLMRDEVFCDWDNINEPQLNIHCHVSGGLVLGSAKWRLSIFKQHMPLVLKAISYGDRDFIKSHPVALNALIKVHFHAKQTKHNNTEPFGMLKDYLL